MTSGAASPPDLLLAQNTPRERRKARGQSPLTPVDFCAEPAFHTPMKRLIPLAALLLLTACATAPLAIEGSRGFFWGGNPP